MHLFKKITSEEPTLMNSEVNRERRFDEDLFANLALVFLAA